MNKNHVKIHPLRLIVIALLILGIVGVVYFYIFNDNQENDQRHLSANSDISYSSEKSASHELLIITDGNKYGFIDKKGNAVGQCVYDMAYLSSNGLYYVKQGKHNSFINSDLETVFTTEETIGTNISEDYVIYTRDGKSGYINIKTGFKIEAVYEAAYDFSDGLAAVQSNGKIGFINTMGEVVIPHLYYSKNLYSFTDGLCNVIEEKEDSSLISYYIDKSGNKVVTGDFQFGMPFYEGMAFVKKDDMLWYVIDINGSKRSDMMFGPYEKTVPSRFKDGVATVISDGKYGMINGEMEFVISPVYEELREISEDLIVYRENGRFGVMTINEKVIIKPMFDSLTNFKHDVSVFGEGDKFGLINKKGKIILNGEFAKIEVLDNGAVRTQTADNILQYYTKKGELIWSSSESAAS